MLDPRTDERLREVVLQCLAADPRTASLHLRVGALHAIVHLGGRVSTKSEWEQAEQVAASISGVRGVVNRIEAPGAPSPSRVIHLNLPPPTRKEPTMLPQPYPHRLEKCGHLMKEAGLDALLLTKPSNMFYLTGDGRLCAYAMITQAGQVALGVPSTDVEDVKTLAHFDQLAGFEDEVGMIHSIAHHFEHFGIRTGTVGLEFTFLTQSMLGMLTHPHAKPEGLAVKDCTHILSTMRTVKEPEEIERIRAAAEVADAGMKAAITAVKVDVTESQVAAAAEYAMRQAGAEEFWRTYVSSGPRTNLAHGLPTNRKLQPGDLVMIDMHPIVNGYSADICRTVCVGQPTVEQQAAYDLYLKAQQATIAKITAGVGMVDLEDTLHNILKNAGHGEHVFGPPLHGVGIEFEEAPLPPGHAFFHGEKAPPPLLANVVISVGNCGLYTGPWGVRVEDTNLVKPDGHETLTSYPRFLEAR